VLFKDPIIIWQSGGLVRVTAKTKKNKINPVQSKNCTQVAMRLKINQVRSKNSARPMVTQIKDNTKPFLPLVMASGVK